MVWDAFRTLTISGPRARLWAVLQDVPAWPRWDVDLTHVKLDAETPPPTLEGATGSLTMKNGRSFAFKIQNLQPNRYLEYRTDLPGATAIWYWDFTKDGPRDAAGVETEFELRMGVRFTGFATFAYRMLLAKECDKAFKICMDNLKGLVESTEAEVKT
ncbi:hypothetical protein BDK51DRAFT_29220 [Blyttiomyces helicus]|uniref:Uncharacterized protein n=1 Tax=Blyttiomyces helicus TaxID=388810 RepID=A0A4P9W3Z5_9FUNG|nr:hypothetical protein BDK51DRAFT_29220 [Blyttiomyces helicus]|eukprot:RKO86035.1 hypothetical protein BDK51DRAFT_29220 [Blyttiomyces helicus]